MGPGRDVARQADRKEGPVPSGGRMTREANAGGRKATGNRDNMAGASN